MYLVTIDDLNLNNKNYTIKPFIVKIPEKDDTNEWNYIVTAYPKISEKLVNNENINLPNYENKENIVSEKELGDELPKTGILTWPIPILAFIGLIFLLIGTFLCIKRDNENE